MLLILPIVFSSISTKEMIVFAYLFSAWIENSKQTISQVSKPKKEEKANSNRDRIPNKETCYNANKQAEIGKALKEQVHCIANLNPICKLIKRQIFHTFFYLSHNPLSLI